MEDVRVRHGQLSEQVSIDSWLGRSLHPSQGTHQQRHRNEVVSVLQGPHREVFFSWFTVVCYSFALHWHQAINPQGAAFFPLLIVTQRTDPSLGKSPCASAVCDLPIRVAVSALSPLTGQQEVHMPCKTLLLFSSLEQLSKKNQGSVG